MVTPIIPFKDLPHQFTTKEIAQYYSINEKKLRNYFKDLVDRGWLKLNIKKHGAVKKFVFIKNESKRGRKPGTKVGSYNSSFKTAIDEFIKEIK